MSCSPEPPATGAGNPGVKENRHQLRQGNVEWLTGRAAERPEPCGYHQGTGDAGIITGKGNDAGQGHLDDVKQHHGQGDLKDTGCKDHCGQGKPETRALSGAEGSVHGFCSGHGGLDGTGITTGRETLDEHCYD